jgi:hypothetical protein
MLVSMFLALSLLFLVALISVVGFYALLKRQQTTAAISERVYTMDIPGVTTPELEMRIPVEWRHEKREGPGFYVHSFRSLNDQGNVTIYIGRNPSIKGGATSRQSVQHVGGKKVEFMTEVTGQTVISQAIVKRFFDGSGNDTISAFLLHITIVEQKRGFTNRVFQALDTLKILE